MLRCPTSSLPSTFLGAAWPAPCNWSRLLAAVGTGPLYRSGQSAAASWPELPIDSNDRLGRFVMKPITTKDAKLGFIGIGYMGRPIAQRLLQAGFSLAAYDRNPAKAEELIRYGGVVAENVAELASGCDVLLSCLPSDEAVLTVHCGTNGTLANMRPDSLVIELSTVSPEISRQVAEQGSRHGVQVLDVTMS